MQKLYPIATAKTRHLFIDPIISQPWEIMAEGYTKREEVSYIKPGIVPNLMDLCKPEGVRFSITEEPDMEKLVVTELIFAAFDYKGDWKLYRVEDLDWPFKSNGPVGCQIKNYGAIDVDTIKEVETGDTAIFEEEFSLEIELDLLYERGTRRLTFTPTGSYDSGKPQVLGIMLNLEHKDSKLI